MTVRAQNSSAIVIPDEGAFDGARFAHLHGRYCDGIWRYLRRLGLGSAEADDATQQVFIVAAQKLATIRTGAERAFLYEVASRVALNVRRRAARRYEVHAPTDALEVPQSEQARPDHLLDEQRRLLLLDSMLASMATELRQVFVLFEIEELTMKEIAGILKIPPGTVASRLRRARDEFKQKAARFRKEEAR